MNLSNIQQISCWISNLRVAKKQAHNLKVIGSNPIPQPGNPHHFNTRAKSISRSSPSRTADASQ
jgi:hypothetical protein